jgi:hypothetical protein
MIAPATILCAAQESVEPLAVEIQALRRAREVVRRCVTALISRGVIDSLRRARLRA